MFLIHLQDKWDNLINHHLLQSNLHNKNLKGENKKEGKKNYIYNGKI